MSSLAPGFAANSCLLALDLEDNEAGVEGAKALADALRANETLTGLSMLRNGIEAEGAKALAVALKENPKTKVKELRLRTDLASRGTAFKSAHFPDKVRSRGGRFYL